MVEFCHSGVGSGRGSSSWLPQQSEDMHASQRTLVKVFALSWCFCSRFKEKMRIVRARYGKISVRENIIFVSSVLPLISEQERLSFYWLIRIDSQSLATSIESTFVFS